MNDMFIAFTMVQQIMTGLSGAMSEEERVPINTKAMFKLPYRNMNIVFSTNYNMASLLWGHGFNDGKTQVISFSRRHRDPKHQLQLNGCNIPFVNNAKYFGVIFNRRMT
jgi:hypothetical protein